MQPGQDIQQSVERQVTPRPVVQGKIKFPCCGRVYEAEGQNIQQVVCPFCRTSYDIMLTARKLSPEKFPRGTKLKITRDVNARVGNEVRVLAAGTIYTAGSDPHGLLGTNEEATLLEVPSPTASHPDSCLLAAVANEFLEEIPLPVVSVDPNTGQNNLDPDG